MSKASKLLKTTNEGLTDFKEWEKDIIEKFNLRLKKFGFESAKCDDVEIAGPDIIVHFSDLEGDEISAVFMVEDDSDVSVIVVDDDDLDFDEFGLNLDDDDEIEVIDLNPLAPPIKNEMFGAMVDLTDLSWLNKSALRAILTVGEVGTDYERKPDKKQVKQDAHGFTQYGESHEEEETVAEKMVRVIRGGKVVKLPVVKRRRKKRLTPAQKKGMRKAIKARKKLMKTAAYKKGRKKAAKLRKRLKLDAIPKGFKVRA